VATSVTGAALAGGASAGGAFAALLKPILAMITTKTTVAALVVFAAVITAYYASQTANEAPRQTASETSSVITPAKVSLGPVEEISKKPLPPAPTPVTEPSRRSSAVQNMPAPSAVDPAVLEAIKEKLAHIGNLVKDGRIQDGQGIDSATVAVIRGWMEQDPGRNPMARFRPHGRQSTHAHDRGPDRD
jgi:hypothetical protein